MDPKVVGTHAVIRVCQQVLDQNRPILGHADIDAWSDLNDLPERAREALGSLRDIGDREHVVQRRGPLWRRWRTRRGPSYMAIPLDLGKGENLSILREFGPYSIHTVVYLRGGEELMTMHDSGTSVAFRWPPDRLAELAEAGVPLGAFIPLPEYRPESRK